MPKYETCKHENIVYGYVRGRDDKFKYPFPVWIATKKCIDCGDVWVLKPSGFDFNSGVATWVPDNVRLPSREMADEADKQR